ncbi:MAG: histidine phosphatase family protein [Chitinophagaceae bacterium]|nr:histidine phosphatase family protein [Chitinophagaceae bacterium]MCW5929500.1 histidine phosphatase family protein [Chitinophagaceae bacterium]
MRTIFFIRHAKSSWDDPAIADFDRPLNDRGKRDAIYMARHLFDQKLSIDVFISSPAIRARKTALYFAKQYAVDKLVEKQELYLPSVQAFSQVIMQIDNQYHNLAIFSHNPGITEFVNRLTDTIRVDNVPTCGIFAVRVFLDNWADFGTATKQFLFFDYPSKFKIA